jgi:tyrosyl-tRNA synthetase
MVLNSGNLKREKIIGSMQRTSPYKFYQFWLNATDEDAERFIKFYTFYQKKK